MGLRWTITPHAKGRLPEELLKDPEGFIRECGKVISAGKDHLTVLCEGLFVKVYRLKSAEGFKGLFRCTKAEREWKGSVRLHQAGVPVPLPLAWGRDGLFPGRGFYVAEALRDANSMDKVGKEKLEALLPAAARAIKAMHDAGIFHRDLHGGNVILKGGEVFLTDLHRHRLYPGGVPDEKRWWDVACFLHSLRGRFSPETREEFLRTYLGREEIPPQLKEVESRVFSRYLKHVRRDCTDDSLTHRQVHVKGLRGWTLKEISSQVLETLLEEHHRAVQEGGEKLRKGGRRSNVTLFVVGGERVCVKEYRFSFLSGLKERFRLPKPRKAWINANLLNARGVGGMKPLAFLEGWRGPSMAEAYLIISSPHGYVEMPRYLRSLYPDRERRKAFMEALISFFLSLQDDPPVWHRDLKAHHIMVREMDWGWDFALIEAEDVRFKKMGWRWLVRNLAQLNTSLPPFVNRTDKVRFLKGIVQEEDLRQLFRAVAKRSSKRTFVYIS